MIFKYFLRAVFKLIFTPFFFFWIIPMLMIGVLMKFHDWLYDKSEWDKQTTNDTHRKFLNDFKQWFTTI